MLLDAGEVATQDSALVFGAVCDARETGGTAFAKGKLERLVGKRTRGG